MLKQSKGVKRREKQKDGSVLSLKGKRGKICAELKLQGLAVRVANGLPLGLRRVLKLEQQMPVMIKQCWWDK